MVDIKKILKNNFIHKPKDFLKVLLGYLVIILFATFPLIIAIEGAKLEHFITGNQVNESKQRFCELADKNLGKLLENVTHIENILVNETENTLQEEMRNKLIDQKIDMLFKEIFSLLNDLNYSKH